MVPLAIRAQHGDMLDRGFLLTWQAMRSQLAAMPHDLYLVRLIHHARHTAFPGERLWSAAQLTSAATIRFLRLRNREGCDIYIHPYAEDRNAGFILLDLDAAPPAVLQTMRRDGLEPGVVVQTSPGHLQAWLHVSQFPLEPALATAVAKRIAHTYRGDPASADWRHLGRLAGFTNQKPERRTPTGHPPWVKLLYARASLASHAEHLLQSTSWTSAPRSPALIQSDRPPVPDDAVAPITPHRAIQMYQHCMRRWNIAERFPQPDWSIVDLGVARELLSQGALPVQVRAILQLGSPQFPRRHGNPQDYLRRTLTRAAFSRPAPPPAVCVTHPPTPTCGEIPRIGSSTTGGP
jgi:hypothetical protein